MSYTGFPICKPAILKTNFSLRRGVQNTKNVLPVLVPVLDFIPNMETEMMYNSGKTCERGKMLGIQEMFQIKD